MEKSFLLIFSKNPVDRWHEALFYHFKSSTPLEYFLEKQRLLRLTESGLSLSSLLALIIHGLPRDLQRQVLAQGPKTLEGLLELLNLFPHSWTERSYKAKQDVSGAPSVNRLDEKCSSVFDGVRSNFGECIARPLTPVQKPTKLNDEEQEEAEGNCKDVSTANETVQLVSSSSLHIQLELDGETMRAFVDSGASVSIIKRSRAKAENILTGRTVVLRGYDGRENEHSEWMRLKLKCQSQTAEILSLVIEGIEYDFLLSRPDMRLLKLNIHWGDTVSVSQDGQEPQPVRRENEIRAVKKGDDIPLIYPELYCCGGYPPGATKFEVPFKLHDETVVRRKPYNLTREKKAWLKEQLAKMLDAGIIHPSVSPYASPTLH